ncbi:MAG: DUF5678 domain-containing protein [Candidatus Odinarchaeota archaeon]
MALNDSIKWVHDNYHKLQEKYSGKYISVYKGEIIATGDSIDEVESKTELILTNDEEYLVEFIERGDLHTLYEFPAFIH